MMPCRSAAGVAAALVSACALVLTSTGAVAAGARSTFTFIPPVNPGSAELSTVSLKSASDAWAVGYRVENQGTVIATLAEHWNGSRWSIIPTVNPSSSNDSLYSVAEVSPSDVWAVGQTGSTYGPLIEHFNGTSWSHVSAGDASGGYQEGLVAVAANSSSNVWAVGYGAIVEHFDGTSWSQVSVPTTVYDQWGVQHVISEFSAVVTNSPSDVWIAAPDSGTGQAVFEHFDGNSWTVVPSPQIGGHVSVTGLAATSAAGVWAVGGIFQYRHPAQQLIEHWNGSSWSIVPGPPAGTGKAGPLYAVTALSPTDVWAASYLDTLPNGSPAWQHYDGSGWTLLGVPSPMGDVRGLGSTPSGTIFAIGNSTSYGLGSLLSTNA